MQCQVESVDENHPPKLDEGESLQEPVNAGDEIDTDRVADGDLSDAARLRRLDTIFSSGDVFYPREFKVLLLHCAQFCVSVIMCTD